MYMIFRYFYSDISEAWNRCGEEPHDIDPINDRVETCNCDENCLKRKDCCADYLQKCTETEDFWLERPCVSEEDFECPGLKNKNNCKSSREKYFLKPKALFII